MEDSSEQQWSWALAVGAVFALYGVCSLYNWFATILGNIRFRPRPQSPPSLGRNAVGAALNAARPGGLNISLLEQMPDEVILKVFSFMTKPQLCRISTVSKRFHRLAMDPSLWRKVNR
jgi:hypothetical protein